MAHFRPVPRRCERAHRGRFLVLCVLKRKCLASRFEVCATENRITKHSDTEHRSHHGAISLTLYQIMHSNDMFWGSCDREQNGKSQQHRAQIIVRQKTKKVKHNDTEHRSHHGAICLKLYQIMYSNDMFWGLCDREQNDKSRQHRAQNTSRCNIHDAFSG